MINIEDAAEQSQQQKDSAKSWRAKFESGNLQADEIILFFQRQAPKFIAIATEEAGELRTFVCLNLSRIVFRSVTMNQPNFLNVYF